MGKVVSQYEKQYIAKVHYYLEEEGTHTVFSEGGLFGFNSAVVPLSCMHFGLLQITQGASKNDCKCTPTYSTAFVYTPPVRIQMPLIIFPPTETAIVFSFSYIFSFFLHLVFPTGGVLFFSLYVRVCTCNVKALSSLSPFPPYFYALCV